MDISPSSFFTGLSPTTSVFSLWINFMVDHLVGFITSMMHYMSSSALGCIVCCSCAFTSLPCLESFTLSCNSHINFLIPPPGFSAPTEGRVVPHTASVVLSKPVLRLFQMSSLIASASLADTLTCSLNVQFICAFVHY